MAARFIGNMQYPSTQTIYKNEIFPPKIFPFIVTIAAPPQIKMKMVPFFRKKNINKIIYYIKVKKQQLLVNILDKLYIYF